MEKVPLWQLGVQEPSKKQGSESETILTSSDGTTWTSRTAGKSKLSLE